MHKFFFILIAIGFTLDCTFSSAHAWGFKKRKETNEYGVDQEGVKKSNPVSFRSSNPLSNFYRDTAPDQNSNPNSYLKASSTHTYHRSGFDCNSLSKICASAPKNCKVLAKKIPNGEALDYTLQFLSDNYGRMQDTSCASGSTQGNNLSKGFSTGKFVLNDIDTRLSNGRGQAHYVDLCSGDYSTYGFKLGTGSTLLDTAGKHSTLAGAFISGKSKHRFNPFDQGKYNRGGLRDPYQVELVGLNSSNNDTDDAKPMHESPSGWNTSWGCPSIDRTAPSVLDKIKGGNLIMNYKKGYMQKLGSGASCRNGNGSGSGNSSGSSSRGGGQ